MGYRTENDFRLLAKQQRQKEFLVKCESDDGDGKKKPVRKTCRWPIDRTW